jgi:quercetin dioxygenase-like cupin family protein
MGGSFAHSPNIETTYGEKSMPEAFVVTPTTTPPSLNVVGEKITVLASGTQTGSYEIFRQAGPEGSGPPPHYHPWDESFYVVKGDIAFGFGGKDMIAVPGTLVHLPAGTTHWFRFGKGGGEMISMTSREGASHFFTDVHRAISPEQPDIPKLIEVANQHHLTVAAPPS